MAAKAFYSLFFFIVAIACGATEYPATPPSNLAVATPDVNAGTETAEESRVLRDRNLLRLVRMYGRLSSEDRERVRAELRKPGVQQEIRKILDNPERLRTIKDSRPELYQRFRKHYELQRQYWELLEQYHQSKDESERAELKTKICERLIELVDAETARYKEQLEWLKQRIDWLEKRLGERLTHRRHLIRRQLEEDLKTLPPPPQFRHGPDERGPDRGSPRGPRGRSGDRPDDRKPPREGRR